MYNAAMWSFRVTIVTMEKQRCFTCHSQQYKDIESVALKYNNTFLHYCQPQVAVNNAKPLPVAIVVLLVLLPNYE